MRLHISSDGFAPGTSVWLEDEDGNRHEIVNVTKVTWSIERDELAIATIEVDYVPVDVSTLVPA